MSAPDRSRNARGQQHVHFGPELPSWAKLVLRQATFAPVGCDPAF
jgi:hypothetical protein